jgi:hypothetical protein
MKRRRGLVLEGGRGSGEGPKVTLRAKVTREAGVEGVFFGGVLAKATRGAKATGWVEVIGVSREPGAWSREWELRVWCAEREWSGFAGTGGCWWSVGYVVWSAALGVAG